MNDDNKPRDPMKGGGGMRPPDYLYAMALARVEDLMMQAIPWPEIFAKLHDEGYTESEDTAKRWRKEVQKRWAVEDAENRPARKDMWRGRLEALFRDLIAEAKAAKAATAKAMLYAEVIKVAKVALVMDGLTAPIQVNHTGSVDVAALQPHERESEIAELLAKREAARAAAARAGGKVYS